MEDMQNYSILHLKAPRNALVFRLTETQREFWTAWRLFPDRPIESACKKFEWLTDLDVDAFRSAVQDLVDVTDALRLRFMAVDGTPFQFAQAECDAGLEFRDFSGYDRPVEDAVAWLGESAKRPFDLTRNAFAPSLAKCGDRRWIFQVNKHHIISDFTSDSLLIGRLAELYEVRKRGARPDRRTWPSFLGHLADQSESDASRRELHRTTPPRLLPILAPVHNPLVGSTRLIRRELHLGAERLARLRSGPGLNGSGSDRRLHPKLLDQCLSATALFMHRLSGERRISIGTPSHNRFRDGSERIIGPLMRTHALSLDLSGNWTTDDLLGAMSAKRHAVFRAIRKGSVLREEPFNVAVNFITHTMPDFDGVRTRELTASQVLETVGLDLVITVRAADTEGDVKILFDVNEEVTEATEPDTLGEVFLRCFDAFSEQPERRLAEVPLCSPEDLEEVRALARAAAETPPPPYLSLPEGFERQAVRTPDAVAAFERDASLSYLELERRSRALAAGLVARGFGKNDIVAIKLPRSIDLVVCMLGVLRANATLFTLDDDVPDERAAAILADTGAPVIIVAEGEGVPDSYPDILVVGPKALAETLEAPDASTLPAVDPDTIMYVMYTSGSKGQPKGIRIPHHSFARDCHWALGEISAGEPVDWALATTLSFESAYWPLRVLVCGGTIGVYNAADGLTGMSLVEAIRDDAVDGVTVTPSQLRLLVERQWDVSRIKFMHVVGEAFPVDIARRAQAAFGPGVEFSNWYGPTETVMATTMHRFDPVCDTGYSVPIGTPADGSAVYVLDQVRSPLPKGLVGELCIGGVRLSSGYVNLPELSARSFVKDPFREDGIMYLSGDLGMVSRDGSLVFLGRKDDQVKVNGVRTELAEVELTIRSHPEIRECAVVLQGAPESRLVAFYVADRDIAEAELSKTVRSRLLAAQVPSAFVRVDGIPLTPSGKADRKALAGMAPEKKMSPANPGAPAKQAPQGRLEQELADIWSGVLDREDVGRLDDFFDLGGNSLAFMQMILRAENRFGIQLPPQAMGRAGTLGQFSSVIEGLLQQSGSQSPPSRTSGNPVNGRGTLAGGETGLRPLSHLRALLSGRKVSAHGSKSSTDEIIRQVYHMTSAWPGEQLGRTLPLLAINRGGLLPPVFWCFNGAEEPRTMSAELGPNQPIFAMRSLEAVVERKQKKRYLNELARNYADEITRAYPGGPYLIGGNCQSGRVAERIARTILHRGLPVVRLMLLDYVPSTPYPGSVSMFFGDRSWQVNPFFLSPEPELAWRRMFADVTWDIIPGAHAEYFSDDNAGPFCRRLAERMEEAHRVFPVRMPPQDRVARLSLSDPHVVARAAEPLTMRAEVRNMGAGDWRPTPQSGLAVVAHWLEHDGSTRTPFSSYCNLDRTLPAGETWIAPLKVIAPDEPGSYRLKIVLVEQGIGKVPNADGKPLIVTVDVQNRQ